MQGMDRWKLADELNVYQIALLMAGYDPSDLERYVSQWPATVHKEAAPFLTALKNAAKSGRFEFNRVSGRDGDIDWDDSTIEIESLIAWLKLRNCSDGFFVSDRATSSAITNPESEFYAIKLAAAVQAWTEVTADPALLNGKSPKRALEIWLRKHANEFGLTNKDGNPNELGIEEICKVANWKPSGGASPTPSVVSLPTPTVRRGRKVTADVAHPKGNGLGFGRTPAIEDDDIPF